MLNADIARQRLHNQLIAQHTFDKPDNVVQWLGAIQAQDYAAAKWAVGLRLPNATDDNIEQACNDGIILRTHIMRPTWHFVTPADIRWLLALTAPRVHAMNASMYRKFELDDATFLRGHAALVKALQGGNQLTRQELALALQQTGIATDDLLRVSLIIMHAELDGVVCSGARRDRQFTYALLDERAPHTRTLSRDEALAELARRYFTGHGPATLQDFVWWSGLTTTDAKAGLEMVKAQLLRDTIDGQTYWFSASAPLVGELPQTAYLLPNYDEYIVGYKNRDAVFDASHIQKLDARGNVLFNHTIIINGRIVGTWKRTIKKDTVLITPDFFTPLNEAEIHAFTASTNDYASFLALPEPAILQVK
ncbi:MAG TPA: winged helix DNA-binding domain-containing protein [Ktedonobacteraceae bacterium]|jgi:hypothetical protein